MHGHQADADFLHDSAFEQVIVRADGGLARWLRRSEWAIDTLRSKEGSNFTAGAVRRRWIFVRDGKGYTLGL